MKHVVLFILLLVSAPVFSQESATNAALVAATTDGLAASRSVSLSEDGKNLIVGEHVIPVSSDTHVKTMKRNATTVEFALQKGTAITSKADASWRRASFSLEFKSKDAAKKFIEAFRKAAAQ